MNLHKLLFPKRHREIQEVTKRLNDLISHNKEMGIHLMNEPFFPEYLKFKLHKDPNDIRVEIYERDGYQISPDTTTGGVHKWFIITPEKTPIIAKIPTMYHAVLFLQSIGAPVSLDTIFNSTDIQELKG